jgi:hypothetical protein
MRRYNIVVPAPLVTNFDIPVSGLKFERKQHVYFNE